MKWITKIYDFFRYDFPYGVSNLISWFPVIWNHRNWDSHYTLIVLKKSLTDLRKVIDDNKTHVGYEKDVKRMTICIECLNRIIADEYHENAFKHHDRKWGELRTWFEEYSENTCQMIFHRPNANTKNEVEQERKECRRCLEHKRMLEKQDIEVLFDTLKYCKGWWD
jgi:hypothetical protein